mgnify:FL=1
MAARPPMPARRRVPPPPTRPASAVPAPEDDHADDVPEEADAVAVYRLQYPVRQMRQTITEIRFERRPVLDDAAGFPMGIGVGLSTHCVELMRYMVPRLCPGVVSATIGALDMADVMGLTGVVVGFWTGSPRTGGQASASSPNASDGAREKPSA